MWSSWAESAKSSVTQALDKTGDVITKAATNAGKSLRVDKNNSNNNGNNEKATAPSTVEGTMSSYNQPTIVQLPPDPKLLSQQSQTQQEEPTEDVAATKNENPMLWFNNVIDATRASFKHAEVAIQEQRIMFQQNITKAISATQYHKRDISLPLDVEALQDAEVVYITDRIITMGHPTCMSRYLLSSCLAVVQRYFFPPSKMHSHVTYFFGFFLFICWS
jgi:hypothetical protein